MRGRYADYSQHLYERPEVHIHVTDGRSFVRNAKQQYDVVQMTLVDTWASTAAGAFALSENSLYTVEAFEEYFDHLKAGWHDRHYPLGIPAAARSLAGGFGGDGGVAPPRGAKSGAGISSWFRKAISMQTEFPSWCWRRRARSLPQRKRRLPGTWTPIRIWWRSICRRPPDESLFGADRAATIPMPLPRQYAYNVAPVYRQRTILFLHR